MARGNYEGRKKTTSKYCDKMIKKHTDDVETFNNEMYECNRVYDFNFEQIKSCEKNSPSHKNLLFIEKALNNTHDEIRNKIKKSKDMIKWYENKKQRFHLCV